MRWGKGEGKGGFVAMKKRSWESGVTLVVSSMKDLV